jgi:hypothetical protein
MTIDLMCASQVLPEELFSTKNRGKFRVRKFGILSESCCIILWDIRRFDGFSYLQGFAELEYGMLRWMGAIDDNTLVVTSGKQSGARFFQQTKKDTGSLCRVKRVEQGFVR